VQLLVGLLGGLIGSVTGGSLTWLTTRWTVSRELVHSYDRDLRTERITAYRQLWQITGALPRYQWPTRVTRSDLRDLIGRFHTWYFEVGGLFFSQAAKDAYFEMLNVLDSAAGRKPGDGMEINDLVFSELFNKAELLRIRLAADVGTGLRAEVTSAELRPAAAPHELTS
jgi:hypothetical protein